MNETLNAIDGLPAPFVVIDGGMRVSGANAAARTAYGDAAAKGAEAARAVEAICCRSLDPVSARRLVLEALQAANGTPVDLCSIDGPSTFRASMSGDSRVVTVDASIELVREMRAEGRSMFISELSHRLRTPLNSVVGFAEVIAMRPFGSDSGRYQEYGEDIAVAGRKMLCAIDQMVTLSMLEGKHVDPHVTTVDVDAALAKAAKASGAAAPSEPTRIMLRADRSLLHQALIAMATAAGGADARMEARVDGGWVEIIAAADADRPESSPEDAPPAEDPEVFIARTIAEAHRGKVIASPGRIAMLLPSGG